MHASDPRMYEKENEREKCMIKVSVSIHKHAPKPHPEKTVLSVPKKLREPNPARQKKYLKLTKL